MGRGELIDDMALDSALVHLRISTQQYTSARLLVVGSRLRIGSVGEVLRELGS